VLDNLVGDTLPIDDIIMNSPTAADPK
jgi:hypothetical protein